MLELAGGWVTKGQEKGLSKDTAWEGRLRGPKPGREWGIVILKDTQAAAPLL